jgi:predicted MFS family arabinose efflux permease
MLTPPVNVVQSSFPEELQGEISGLSRSVSNLGSSLGAAIAGTILVSVVANENRAYAVAMAALAVIGHRTRRGLAPPRQARAAGELILIRSIGLSRSV